MNSNIEEIPKIRCPMCNTEHFVFDLFLHMHSNHPAFLAIWTAVNVPQLDDNSILNMFQFNQNENEFDEYEYYSNLCESIGNHTIFTDPDDVSTFIDSTDLNENCTICLESMNDKLIRSLNICSHKFCSECITTWLDKHKTCPICKKDSTEQLPLQNPYKNLK
ncbi:MAG: RING-H2 finger protein [Bacteroidetes bacterium]|nr:RING-H2 finger protein [Bacteroidota bacterium]